MADLSGEACLILICVDLTLVPVELLVFICGEKIRDVCGKLDVTLVEVDVTMVAVERTLEGVVTCSVM